MYINICTLRFINLFLRLFSRSAQESSVFGHDQGTFSPHSPEISVAEKNFQERKILRGKTDQETEHKANNDYFPGCCMSSVDERELAEVRKIEEGLRSAYDGDSEGVIVAFKDLRNFTVDLVHLEITAENELDAKALIIAMGDIGRETAEQRMEAASIVSAHALEEVAVEAADQRRESLALKALAVLGKLALELGGKGMDAAAKSAAESLGSVGKVSSKKKREVLTGLSEVYLMQLSMKALEENLKETWGTASTFLGEIGASSAEQAMEKDAVGAAILLEELGAAAVKRQDEPRVKDVIHALGKLGHESSLQGSKNALVQTVWALETLRILALESKMESAGAEGKQELKLLNTAGIPDEEQNLEKIQEIKEFHQRILKRD
jgi:hypothetical protein